MILRKRSHNVDKLMFIRIYRTTHLVNPFVVRKAAPPEIYTYGHRNAQGLAWHPQTGELWATEIGPMGGDELNRLVPGHNYGWPLVTLGKIYTGHLASDQPWARPGMDN